MAARERLAAVMREALPRPLVKLARQVAQAIANDVLRSVGRAGVHDYPLIDKRVHGRKASADHRLLVLHDHVKADGLPGGVHDFWSPRRRDGSAHSAVGNRSARKNAA